MISYPQVMNEFDTIAKASQGFCLSRFGDGELKMAYGNGYSRQVGNPRLAAELTRILCRPNKRCIVGIPTMNPDGPKYQNWTRHIPRFLPLLSSGVVYYSAFVTRPDSSPWIATRAYAESVQAMWAGKKTAVLCERKGSMFRAVAPASRSAIHVECPRVGAYDEIDRLEYEVMRVCPEIVIMSAGPAATCLADRLARRGVHAVDMGSAGRFIIRMLNE